MKKKLLLGLIALFVAVIAVGSAAYAFYQPAFVYRVYVDGEAVGTVENFAEYADLLADFLREEEARVGLSLQFKEEVSACRELQAGAKADTPSLKTALAARLSYSTLGWAIAVRDEALVWTATEEQAQEVLLRVANSFFHQSDNRVLLKAEIIDPVEVCAQVVSPEDIYTVEAAVDYVLQGQEAAQSYAVSKGDSLWSISRGANISESDLKKANPVLKEDPVLKVGQVLNLVTAEAKLHVRILESVKTYQSVPFSTTYKYTDKRWSNQSAVVVKGTAGKKAVYYQVESVDGVEIRREVARSSVEVEPVAKVIEKGTSRWPSAATGIFRWPLTTGYITSYFGARWGSTHGGVDIGAPTGTSIYAAASGTVVTAQWNSSYGNYVKIDHGNGYATLYAHASALLVQPGQKVSKGQIIARVGSTGNSTGPHLHFEVQRNGVRINALQFFKP